MVYAAFIIALIIGTAIGYVIATFIKGKELALKDRELALERGAADKRDKDANQFDQRFENVANKVLEDRSKKFESDFEKKEKSIENTVEALRIKIEELEKQRSEQAGALNKSIENVLTTGAKMEETAHTLKTVLSSASAVRGRWGETALRNLLEQSGLTEGTDFLVQETVVGDGASLRPDIVINLPGGLKLAVDSKAGLEEFFKAVEENDAEKKRIHLAKFGQALQGHIQQLSSKEYQKYIDDRIPYVIMFVPSEAAVRAAFEQDKNLYNDAQAKKIMLASPATIMPLILLIAHAWKQQKTAENVTKLAKEITELGGRLKTFLGHVVGIGASISGATKKFNEAVASWDSRVSPKIEQINMLGGNMQIDENPSQIDIEPRASAKLLGGSSK